MPATDALRDRRPLARLLALAAAIGAAGLAGCYYPGGPGYSADRYTYPSTTWEPKTIVLEDTRTGQEFWAVEVPVGHQLVVGFIEDAGTDGEFTPDLMQWEIMPLGERFGELDNSLPVPSASARLLKMRLRSVPELPADMVAAQGGPAPVRVIEPVPPAEAPAPAPETTPE